MNQFIAGHRASLPAGQRLRERLQCEEILPMPGVYNGLSALQAKAAGFEALYLSGAAMSASMGLPDLGVTTIDDVCFFIRQVARATDLPVLVDGDTGFGEVLNVMQTVRAFEEAGAAAIQLEDQVMPKKCGHLDGKVLVPAEDMAVKIEAAASARRDLYIVARTDAVASEGLDSAIARARNYLDAGADAIFAEALASADDYKTFADAIDAPLLANMTEFGKSPLMTASELQSLGCKMVIWPVSALRIAARAQENLYREIATKGTANALIEQMQTRAELYDTIDYYACDALTQGKGLQH